MKPSDIQTEIKQLIKISTETPSVLSIYLDTSGTTESRMNDVYVFLKRAHNIEKTKFRDKPTALAPLEANYKRLLGFLESELEPHFRGVAVFISNEIGLFIPFKSMLPFKNSYTLGNSPYLKQLLELSDDYKPTLLVAMDSREAKIMKIVLGGFLSKEEILSDVEGRVAGVGKMNELKWQHRVDFHKKEHAKGVSSEISRLVDQEGFKAIILSGQPKNVAMLKEEFPKRVLSLVTYEIPLERFLPEQTAVKHVIDEIQKTEKDEEDRLVTDLITMAKSQGNGALTGVRKTVDACNKGLIRKLVVSDQLVLNGFHCPSCKSLYDEFKMGCTVCGGGLLEVDLGYALMSRTKELDGEIEVVHNNKSLNDRGAVGAFLRNLNR